MAMDEEDAYARSLVPSFLTADDHHAPSKSAASDDQPAAMMGTVGGAAAAAAAAGGLPFVPAWVTAAAAGPAAHRQSTSHDPDVAAALGSLFQAGAEAAHEQIDDVWHEPVYFPDGEDPAEAAAQHREAVAIAAWDRLASVPLESLCGNMSIPQLLLQLVSHESDHLPIAEHLRKIQREDITPALRSDALDTALNVARQFGFHGETFAYSVNILDRVLCRLRIRPEHMPIIAFTSLYVAAKMLEPLDRQPALRPLCELARAAFSHSDILRMERIIIEKLGWDLTCVTPHVLMHQVASVLSSQAGVDEEWLRTSVVALAEIFVEQCLLEGHFVGVRPSVMAACAMTCALQRLGRPPHTVILYMLNVSPDDQAVRDCLRTMQIAVANTALPIVAARPVW
jgi:hypothetical protein